MATLYLTQHFSVVNDGVTISGGSRSSPEEIASITTASDQTKVLATATTWDAWITGSDEALTDFDFMYVSSDRAVLLELVCDTGNNVGRVPFVIEVQAGVPFILPTDDSRALHTVDFATGSDDVIDAVRVRNESGSDATVRVALFS